MISLTHISVSDIVNAPCVSPVVIKCQSRTLAFTQLFVPAHTWPIVHLQWGTVLCCNPPVWFQHCGGHHGCALVRFSFTWGHIHGCLMSYCRSGRLQLYLDLSSVTLWRQTTKTKKLDGIIINKSIVSQGHIISGSHMWEELAESHYWPVALMFLVVILCVTWCRNTQQFCLACVKWCETNITQFRPWIFFRVRCATSKKLGR